MKILVVLISVLLLLSSCSVQEKVDFDILVDRIVNYNNSFNADTDASYRKNNTYICFLTDNNKKEYLLEAQADENGCIYKISVSAESHENEKDFLDLINAVLASYVTDDNTDNLVEQLFNKGKIKEGLEYYDTQWYCYSTVFIDSHYQFTVKNKKLQNFTENQLTLKENDKSYLR